MFLRKVRSSDPHERANRMSLCACHYTLLLSYNAIRPLTINTGMHLQLGDITYTSAMDAPGHAGVLPCLP